MYLMVENNMQVGIATISHRYAQPNNPLVEGYDPSKPTSFILYADANNLYGGAMNAPLPVGNFRFLTEQEIADFNLMDIPLIVTRGTSQNVILPTPNVCIISTMIIPWRRIISQSHQIRLVTFVKKLKSRKWKPTQKLVPNLRQNQLRLPL